MENLQARELRIGNFVYENHKLKEIHSVSNHNAKDYSKIQPIPITEEWLLKFGFNDKENQYRYKDRLIVIRDNDFHDYGTSVKLKYVHQLQNLYFALTNNELIIR